jgi:sister chromatid cohesion protein DCC1
MSTVTLLQEALPLYDIVAGDVDATANGRSKASVFMDLPMSDGECQIAWDRATAFEHEDSTYRPSANALSQVWGSISAAALAEGVKLDSQFLTDDITRAVAEEGHPPGLVEAILRYLCKEDQDKNGLWSCLERSKTVAFVGRTLLEARQGNDFLIADFTAMWEDRLPEAWRKDAKLAVIDGLYEIPTDITIRAKGMGTANSQNATAPAATKPSARKWHEKFGKTRKQ